MASKSVTKDQKNTTIARDLVNCSQRIIIKLGSSVSIGNPDIWSELAREISILHSEGKQVVVVASGAVSLGRISGGNNCPETRRRRAWASTGQMQLTSVVQCCFTQARLKSGQILLRYSDTTDQLAINRITSLINDLCEDGAVPILNEDDCHRIEGAHFSDNDHLAAWIGNIWRSELIIFLTDTDGIYENDPRVTSNSRRLQHLDVAGIGRINIDRTNRSSTGTGGMASKIDAARKAMEYGCNVIIASGLKKAPILAAQFTSCCTTISNKWEIEKNNPVPLRTATEGALS